MATYLSESEEELSVQADSDEEIQDQMEGGVTNQQKLQRAREKERAQQEKLKWEFPQRIGSYNNYTQPALEFVKMITKHVFSLDESFIHQSTSLKQNLLRVIHAKEFSPEV